MSKINISKFLLLCSSVFHFAYADPDDDLKGPREPSSAPSAAPAANNPTVSGHNQANPIATYWQDLLNQWRSVQQNFADAFYPGFINPEDHHQRSLEMRRHVTVGHLMSIDDVLATLATRLNFDYPALYRPNAMMGDKPELTRYKSSFAPSLANRHFSNQSRQSSLNDFVRNWRAMGNTYQAFAGALREHNGNYNQQLRDVRNALDNFFNFMNAGFPSPLLRELLRANHVLPQNQPSIQAAFGRQQHAEEIQQKNPATTSSSSAVIDLSHDDEVPVLTNRFVPASTLLPHQGNRKGTYAAPPAEASSSSSLTTSSHKTNSRKKDTKAPLPGQTRISSFFTKPSSSSVSRTETVTTLGSLPENFATVMAGTSTSSTTRTSARSPQPLLSQDGPFVWRDHEEDVPTQIDPTQIDPTQIDLQPDGRDSENGSRTSDDRTTHDSSSDSDRENADPNQPQTTTLGTPSRRENLGKTGDTPGGKRGRRNGTTPGRDDATAAGGGVLNIPGAFVFPFPPPPPAHNPNTTLTGQNGSSNTAANHLETGNIRSPWGLFPSGSEKDYSR